MFPERLRIQTLPDVLIVRMFGQVDQSVGDMFQKVAGRAMSLGQRKVMIDFWAVDSIDSLSLVLFGFGLHHLRELGIPVSLVQPPPTLLSSLQNQGLTELPPVSYYKQGPPIDNQPSPC